MAYSTILLYFWAKHNSGRFKTMSAGVFDDD